MEYYFKSLRKLKQINQNQKIQILAPNFLVLFFLPFQCQGQSLTFSYAQTGQTKNLC